MSGPKLPLPRPKLGADPSALMRIAASLEALVGSGWEGRRYGIAVSGGADSMALLDIMAECLPAQVLAATVDHGLRKGSSQEASMVADWCADRQILHEILKPTAPITGSLQAAARAARYDLLEEWRGREALDFVLTAHHADDQLETMIMRLNRSSGVGGLASIRGRQRNILRPILQWRRSELERWVQQRGVPYVTDPSNSDPRFDRARLRQSLSEQCLLDPQAMARSAAWLDQADQALEWMVDQSISAWPDAADGLVIRDYDYPDELFRRIVSRRLCEQEPALSLRGTSLDGVVQAMRSGHRAMVGQLLIDPQLATDGSVWRISVAPRRNQRAK